MVGQVVPTEKKKLHDESDPKRELLLHVQITHGHRKCADQRICFCVFIGLLDLVEKLWKVSQSLVLNLQ